MPRFAANLAFLFTEVPFEQRFAEAARAGFKGVEYPFPYEHKPQVLAGLLRDNGLTQVLINAPAGDWAAGDRGIAAVPGRAQAFRESLETAMTYADILDCKRVHVMAGVVDEADWDQALDVYLDNLVHAADRAREWGVVITVEPINPYDVPGYFMQSPAQAVEILEGLEKPALKLQLDLYHAQTMEGHLSDTIEANLPRIAHVQVAGVPGRHEPDVGEINYPYLFHLLDASGYGGWIGCEYHPRTTTSAGLGWLKGWL